MGMDGMGEWSVGIQLDLSQAWSWWQLGKVWERHHTRVAIHAHACTSTHVLSTHGSTGISTCISSNARMDRRSNEDSRFSCNMR